MSIPYSHFANERRPIAVARKVGETQENPCCRRKEPYIRDLIANSPCRSEIMVQLQDIRNLFEYNDWANEVLFEMLIASFGADTDLRAAPAPMVRDIQEAATHIVAALCIWRTRWQGTSPTAMLDPALFPTPRALHAAFGSERVAFWTFFDGLESDDCLALMVAYNNTRGDASSLPLVAMMQHVVNHSTYHRGQITARLIALGFDDVIQSTDFSTWTMLKKP
jgi:uncharacterized damage-inducible protein DinB